MNSVGDELHVWGCSHTQLLSRQASPTSWMGTEVWNQPLLKGCPPTLAKAKIRKSSTLLAREGPGAAGSWTCPTRVRSPVLTSSHPERCLENKRQTTRDILVGKSLAFLAASFLLLGSAAPGTGGSRLRRDGRRPGSRSL